MAILYYSLFMQKSPLYSSRLFRFLRYSIKHIFETYSTKLSRESILANKLGFENILANTFGLNILYSSIFDFEYILFKHTQSEGPLRKLI